MPRLADYRCQFCGAVFEVWKSDLEDWPKTPECTECGSNDTYRKYSFGVFDIAEGQTRTKDGAHIAKHPSTKYGKYKGQKT